MERPPSLLPSLQMTGSLAHDAAGAWSFHNIKSADRRHSRKHPLCLRVNLVAAALGGFPFPAGPQPAMGIIEISYCEATSRTCAVASVGREGISKVDSDSQMDPCLRRNSIRSLFSHHTVLSRQRLQVQHAFGRFARPSQRNWASELLGGPFASKHWKLVALSFLPPSISFQRGLY